MNKNSPFVARFLTTSLNTDLAQLHPDLVPELGRFSIVLSSDTALERILCKSSSDLMGALRNVAGLLKPGGFFAGMLIDSAEVWGRAIHVNTQKSLKSSFSTASGHISIDMKKMAYLTSMEPSFLAPYPDQTFDDWLSTNPPTLGLEYSLTTPEGRGHAEELFVVHISTLVNAAAEVGLKCISFRNLIEFYDMFKLREEEQLRKMQVVTKHAPKILPDQKDAASLYAVFVFQKEAC